MQAQNNEIGSWMTIPAPMMGCGWMKNRVKSTQESDFKITVILEFSPIAYHPFFVHNE